MTNRTQKEIKIPTPKKGYKVTAETLRQSKERLKGKFEALERMDRPSLETMNCILR